MQRLSLLLNSVREPECPEGQTCEGPPNWKAVITFMGKRPNQRESKPIVKGYTHSRQLHPSLEDSILCPAGTDLNTKPYVTHVGTRRLFSCL